MHKRMHTHKGRIQTAMENPTFSQSRLEPDNSFEVLTLTNHMKSDFCKPDRNHLREVVSNRIWTEAFQSEQLQTLRSVLTVRDVTRDARPPSDHSLVSSCGVISTEWSERRRKHQSLDRGWNEMPLWWDSSVVVVAIIWRHTIHTLADAVATATCQIGQ